MSKRAAPVSLFNWIQPFPPSQQVAVHRASFIGLQTAFVGPVSQIIAQGEDLLYEGSYVFPGQFTVDEAYIDSDGVLQIRVV